MQRISHPIEPTKIQREKKPRSSSYIKAELLARHERPMLMELLNFRESFARGTRPATLPLCPLIRGLPHTTRYAGSS